jgi:3-(3-hydroxy-phenyl)propionate hydroxylase
MSSRQSSSEAVPGLRPVLVVGAGPVGLTAALALRALDVPVTVLEAEPRERVRPGSRAIYVHRESLALLEQVRPGLGWELAAHGLVWPTRRTLWRGREVFVRTYSPARPDRLPPFTSLPQIRTEDHLYDACKAAGVEFSWCSPVAEVETTPAGVRLLTEFGDEWTADYVVGADGARSAVRRAIGVEMRGCRTNARFVVVDVEEDPAEPMPRERVFHYEHPAVDRNVLLVPFAGGWRLDLQCSCEDEVDALTCPDGVRSWVPRVMAAKYADHVTWVSSYRFLQVVADDFTDPHRRVLLAGEAAHLFAPFGARGMNSGIADAVAAASAIHTARSSAQGQAARHAVERFAATRRGAAERNRAAAGAALAHLMGDGMVRRTRRRTAAMTAQYIRRTGEWLDNAPYGIRSGSRAGSSARY